MSTEAHKMMPADTPRPADSRAIRIAQFRKTVEKVAPTIDQTRVLSAEEVEQLKAEHETRQEDRRCAARDGRSGVRERFHRSVERVTGNTPPDGAKLPSRMTGTPDDVPGEDEEPDPLADTDDPE